MSNIILTEIPALATFKFYITITQCRGKGKWAPPEISRGAPHTLLAYYYELQ